MKQANKQGKKVKKYHGSKWIRKEKRLAIYLLWNLSCAYCGTGLEEGITLELDHLVARDNGGNNHESNLVTCCGTCNKQKNTRSWETFARDAAIYSDRDPALVISIIEAKRLKKIAPYVEVAKEMIESRGSYAKALEDAPSFLS